jgi:hypothetical protein
MIAYATCNLAEHLTALSLLCWTFDLGHAEDGFLGLSTSCGVRLQSLIEEVREINKGQIRPASGLFAY